MELTAIKQLIAKYYKEECGIDIQGDKFTTDFSVIPLFSNGFQGLDKGSGHPDKKLEKINSSARLAVFYYKMLEQTGRISALRFEWNESTPLVIPERNIPPANLDVRYETANEIHFVESKYLEPYYSGNEKIICSYLNDEYYSNIPNSALWIKKFRQVNSDFIFLNVTQLYRHLLAIYRHYLENPQVYVGKQIVFESVSWKPTNRFIDLVEKQSKRSKSYLEKRIECIIEKEAKDAITDINDFIKSLNWPTCHFEMKYYNDMLGDIKAAPQYNAFRKQYFFD